MAYIIAECGVNHNGYIDMAKDLMRAAADVGVDAVKFQMFHTEQLVLEAVSKAPYQGTIGTQASMLKELELSMSTMGDLQVMAANLDLDFIITPFDFQSLREVVALEPTRLKIASTDLSNTPFLRLAGEIWDGPLIISTGGHNQFHIEQAIRTLGCVPAILQCTSAYPCPPEEANLEVIAEFSRDFGLHTIGLSDHTTSIMTGAHAIGYGAEILEKHFTLDRAQDGPDHKASLDPLNMRTYVLQVEYAETLAGNRIKLVQPSEEDTIVSGQKHIIASRYIAIDEKLSPENCTTIRTGGKGMPAIEWDKTMGETADYEIPALTPLERWMLRS